MRICVVFTVIYFTFIQKIKLCDSICADYYIILEESVFGQEFVHMNTINWSLPFDSTDLYEELQERKDCILDISVSCLQDETNCHLQSDAKGNFGIDEYITDYNDAITPQIITSSVSDPPNTKPPTRIDTFNGGLGNDCAQNSKINKVYSKNNNTRILESKVPVETCTDIQQNTNQYNARTFENTDAKNYSNLTVENEQVTESSVTDVIPIFTNSTVHGRNNTKLITNNARVNTRNEDLYNQFTTEVVQEPILVNTSINGTSEISSIDIPDKKINTNNSTLQNSSEIITGVSKNRQVNENNDRIASNITNNDEEFNKVNQIEFYSQKDNKGSLINNVALLLSAGSVAGVLTVIFVIARKLRYLQQSRSYYIPTENIVNSV